MLSHKNTTSFFFLLLVILIFSVLPFNRTQAQIIATPIIVSVKAGAGANETIIKGTAVNSTKVMLFLDNRFIGSATANETTSTSSNFSYVLNKDLAEGRHMLTAVDHDSKTQAISDYSQPFVFIVSAKKEINVGSQTNVISTVNLPPAPVLQDPLTINSNGQPLIIGWAKNNLTINLFLDEKPLASFPVKNSDSSTASFSYVLHEPLTNNGHLLYVTATDNSGRVSIRSNYIYYLASSSISGNEQPSGSNQIVGKSDQEKQTVISEKSKITGDDKELVDILKQDQVSENEKSGMINESKEMQGKLKWNLIIFVLFLVAVIVWIFWVNRELIKEKREQNKKEEEKNNKQDKLV